MGLIKCFGKVVICFVVMTMISRTAARICNGLQETCGLRFDQVTFAGTHNSGAGSNGVLKYGFLPALSCFYRNQEKSFTYQLESSIRLFDIDPCMKGSSVYICHNTAYGGSMFEAFKQIGDYLQTHGDDVVVIRVSDVRTGVDLTKFIAEFKNRFTGSGGKTGLNDYKSRTGSFPTINQAINENKRVFVFMKNSLCDSICRSNNRFILSEDTYIEDTTPFPVVTESCSGMPERTGQRCADSRSKPLLLASLFGGKGLCVKDMAKKCNPYVESAVEICATERNKFDKTINFIIVDYYNLSSDVVGVADAQNRATAARLNRG